jgi:type IV pilus assembly protein PilE
LKAQLRQPGGFTVAELLVALLVVAVLVAVAVPGYRAHVTRTQRTDATAALARVQAAQERHFLEYNRYAASLASAPPSGLGLPATSEAGFYDVALETGDDGWTFRVVARPRNGKGPADDDRCRELSIDQAGMRGARDSTGKDTSEACWR